MRKLRTYLACSVWVDCPDKYRASNNGKQFTVLCRTSSKKRMAYILGTSLHSLTEFSGAHETDQEKHTSIVKNDHTIYYHVEHTITGWVDEWVEWTRPDWLNKRDPL